MLLSVLLQSQDYRFEKGSCSIKHARMVPGSELMACGCDSGLQTREYTISKKDLTKKGLWIYFKMVDSSGIVLDERESKRTDKD